MELNDYIRQTKAELSRLSDTRAAFASVRDAMLREVETITTASTQGDGVIPELDYAQIKAGSVSEAARKQIRHRGCAVIRGVFPRAQAEDWNA
ncbi:MAG: YbiU family protein, partial [Pseudomonadota bacterium]